jgi:hypothetical protein
VNLFTGADTHDPTFFPASFILPFTIWNPLSSNLTAAASSGLFDKDTDESFTITLVADHASFFSFVAPKPFAVEDVAVVTRLGLPFGTGTEPAVAPSGCEELVVVVVEVVAAAADVCVDSFNLAPPVVLPPPLAVAGRVPGSDPSESSSFSFH